LQWYVFLLLPVSQFKERFIKKSFHMWLPWTDWKRERELDRLRGRDLFIFHTTRVSAEEEEEEGVE
jgi:hypothetical protein